MAQQPIDVYLNDHLAGATFGADLARQLEARTEATDFHGEMSRLAADIEADLDTLTDLMNRIGCAPKSEQTDHRLGRRESQPASS